MTDLATQVRIARLYGLSEVARRMADIDGAAGAQRSRERHLGLSAVLAERAVIEKRDACHQAWLDERPKRMDKI